jgi:hypothetical protein
MKKLLVSLSLASLTLTSLALADDPNAHKTAVAAPPKMEAPKPPQELTDLAKSMGGTWQCTGKVDVGGTMHNDAKGTVTHKVDLDGFWISSSITSSLPGLGEMHAIFLTAYDASAKKFYRLTANSRGGHGTGWGTAAGKKISWEGDSHFPTGDVKFRGSEEMVSPTEVHVLGEYSKDGGKTWTPDHELTCKK